MKSSFRVGAMLLSAATAWALAVAPVSAATTTRLTATFAVHFPKGHPASNAPCPADAFCGVGSVAGLGPATITILDESFSEPPDSPCLAVTRTEQIDLLDGGGRLVVSSIGTFCRPGRSGDSHATQASYGSPGVFAFSFTIDRAASTGRFAGASGSGSERMKVAGGVGTWHLAGSLHLG